MRKIRCIFCMQEMDAREQRCPHCNKALWQYAWEARWLRPYTELSGRYLIGRMIGEGAFSVTYIAYDKKEQIPVAVKVFSGNGLEEEAAVLEKTKNIPAVVRKKAFFREKGLSCLVMEYLEGQSLRAYMKKRRQTPAQEAAGILLPVMRALISLHARGILHLDISPDNLIFTGEGNLKLIDFGAAQEKGNEREGKELKESYAPPELYQEKEKCGPWTDLYGVCAVWYEMVTGHKAPPAPERLKKDSLKPADTYVKVPGGMGAVFSRGLSLEIQKRYFSLENFLEQLGMDEVQMIPEESRQLRDVWGDLWIEITTQVERSLQENVRREKIRKIIRSTAGVFLGLAAAAAVVGGSLWAYCETHPDKVLAYERKQDQKEAQRLEKKVLIDARSEEYKEAVAFLKKNAYEKEERDYISTYRLSAQSLKDWQYAGDQAGVFPVKADTARKAMDLFTGKKAENNSRTFNGFIQVYETKKREPVSCYINWEERWYYGKDAVYMCYDLVTEFVTQLSFTSTDEEETKRFLLEMLPVISPESCLTEKEVGELFQTLEEKEEFLSIILNAKCQFSISKDSRLGFSVALYTR